MILEGLVTTLDPDGVAAPRPDGAARRRRLVALPPAPVPHVAHLPQPARPTARACCTSPTTCCCWRRPRSGPVDPPPALRPAERVAASCSPTPAGYYEFVVAVDRRARGAGAHRGRGGPRRAAARLLRLQPGQARGRRGGHPGDAAAPAAAGRGRGRVPKLRVIVEKTGGPAEHEAMDFLEATSKLRGRGGRAMTRVVAPSRLHFGLFHVPADGPDRWPGSTASRAAGRHFGGVGLMVDGRASWCSVEPADAWQSRAARRAGPRRSPMRFVGRSRRAERRPFRVLVEQCPGRAHRPRGRHAARRSRWRRRWRSRPGTPTGRRSTLAVASAAASGRRSASTGSTAAG